MRIAYLSTSRFPSSAANSVHVTKMCDALAAHGHLVTLFAEQNEKGYSYTNLSQTYGLSHEFDIQFLNSGGALRRRINSLCFAIMSRNYDIAYARNLTAAVFAAQLGQSVIFEVHAPLRGRWARMAFKRLMTFPNCLGLISITHALKLHYEETLPLFGKTILVVPDGADVEKTGGLEKATYADGRFAVGYVGNLYPGKGMEIIVNLARSCEWATFHVVGGNEQDQLYWRRLCSGIPNIIFHGYVPHKNISQMMHIFDVALLPNQPIIRAYGFGSEENRAAVDIGSWTSPLKLFEYMSAGLPIIASDLPVLKEILQHQHNSLLCPPDNIEAWASSLRQLRDDGKLRAKIARNARTELNSRYSWRARAEAVMSLARYEITGEKLA